MKQRLAATHRRLGVACRFEQQLLANLLLGNRLALHEFLELLQVLVGVESDALPLAVVATGATRFLIVAFEALGDVVVNHKSHIRLVDTHAEGDSSHNHIDGFEQKSVLIGRACCAVHTGVVGKSLDVVHLQCFGKFFHLFAAEAIDDARLTFVGLDELYYILIDILGLWAYLVVEVGAVE